MRQPMLKHVIKSQHDVHVTLIRCSSSSQDLPLKGQVVSTLHVLVLFLFFCFTFFEQKSLRELCLVFHPSKYP